MGTVPKCAPKGEGDFLKGRKKLFIVAAAVVIALGIVYTLWGGLEKNMVYFVTPSELLAKGTQAVGNPVRLGGVVADGTLHFEGNTLSFELTDDHKNVPVVTTKTPPQMFREGLGAVVEGALRADGKFEAERLMVKHGNEYRPPKEGEMPQQIYKELRPQQGN
jgi:cytochrome c-type biogenesis protein CcmE